MLEELKVGPVDRVWGYVANRVVDISNLTIELVRLKEGLLEVGWILVATGLHCDHILVSIEVLSILILVVEQDTATRSPSLLVVVPTAAKQKARFVLARL